MAYGLRLDFSMDPMEETRIKKKYTDFIKECTRRYHFNQVEVEMIILIYHKIKRESDPKQKGISKSQFRKLLHSGFDMTDDTLMERIFTALEGPGSFHPSSISMRTWTSAMSLFLRGTLEEKIDHCFTVYNLMGDGFIGRDSIFALLRKSLISTGSDDDAEESVKDMIEVLSKKMDLDRDGKISYNDYKQSVLTEPMLLECFGQCLPSRMAVNTFLNTILPDAGRF